MSKIQQPNVAGMFYPGDPASLEAEVSSLLSEAEKKTSYVPKALIAPHAGYIYSGPVAASAYAQLHHSADIRQVVVLAPSHRVPFQGLAVPTAEYFATPLGTIKVDQEAIDSILDLPQVMRFDRAFAGEHALEVQLPFLQKELNEFELVPIIVGDANSQSVSEVLERLWGSKSTLIVVSSDLSHYHSYEDARHRDQRTTSAIESMQPENIGYEDACGRNPVNGLLVAAQHHGLQVETLDLRNSGDTAGDKSRVVGYGAYVFH